MVQMVGIIQHEHKTCWLQVNQSLINWQGWLTLKQTIPNTIKNITSKGSIALRAGRANARRCFGRYT